MKYLIVIFLFVCLLTNSQENGQSRLSLRAYYTPDICYRFLDGASWIVDLRNEREIIKYGNSIGIGLSYNLNSLISIETGIQYTSQGFQTKKITINTREPDPVMPNKVKVIDRFNYIGIPIRLYFTKDVKKFSFKSSLGIITNYLIFHEYENIDYYDDQTIIYTREDTEEYNRLMLTPIISLGSGYQITKSIEIQLEPTFQYNIMKVQDAPIKTYLWNLGLNMSIFYKF